jgi:hypothetical protein
MPEARTVDWEAMRKDRVEGRLSYAKLAAKYNLPHSTVAYHAVKKGWDSVPHRARRLAASEMRQAVKAHVNTALQEAKPVIDAEISKWTSKAHATAGLAMEQVRDKLESPMEVDDLLKTVSALDKADIVGRRALGLDKEANAQNPNARPNISINLGVGLVDPGGRPSIGLPGDYGNAPSVQVIDVQGESDAVK